jgi:hypothetical protein
MDCLFPFSLVAANSLVQTLVCPFPGVFGARFLGWAWDGRSVCVYKVLLDVTSVLIQSSGQVSLANSVACFLIFFFLVILMMRKVF